MTGNDASYHLLKHALIEVFFHLRWRRNYVKEENIWQDRYLHVRICFLMMPLNFCLPDYG